MSLILKNGRLIDPGTGRDEIGDVVIHDDRIREAAAGIAAEGPVVIDCTGLVIAPGFIDLHTHLREPGQEYKEDIASGTQAAVAGGFTAICAMPNTQPVNDHAGGTAYLIQRAHELGRARVFPIGAITAGSQGERLAEIGSMRTAGAVAISDDGHPVSNGQRLRRALEYASRFQMPVIEHCEDLLLSAGGVMHEGATSYRLGLPGISAVSEAAMVSRDLLLAEQTGAHLHIAHISTALSVQLLREAKRRGVRATAEVTPHHFPLCDEDIRDYDANFKMNPPLRSRADREALIQALAEGVIDAIATDHAPHAAHEKQQEFTRAPFGIIGLETALPLALALVRAGRLSLMRMVEAFTNAPAAILGHEAVRLATGSLADLTVFDPNRKWICRPETLHSKSRNTPFIGWELQGRAVYTIVGGRLVYQLLQQEAAVG